MNVLDMKEQKDSISSIKFEITKDLGKLITCYNIKSVMETLSTNKFT
jgi:hypothetical protein